MRKIAFLHLFFLWSVFLYSQSVDSSLNIEYKDLKYGSMFEKSGFDELQFIQNPDFLKMSMAVNSTITDSIYKIYKNEFYKTLREISSSNKFTKKPEKRVKFVFNTLHDKYFKLYEFNTGFSDIFINGSFNCLTASVLYALAFREFNIPYEVRVSKEHAYLIAYPDDHSVVVETTNPLKGTSGKIDQREKQKYIESLINMKLVTQEELQQKSLDELFREHFSKEDGIGIKESIGSLYSNAGVFLLDKFKHAEAYDMFEKSYFIYPRKDIAVLMLFCASSFIDKRDYNDPRWFELMNKLPQFISFGIGRSNIEGEYHAFLHEYMNNRNDISFADSMYNKYLSKIEDSIINNNVGYFYYFEKGRLAYLDYKIQEAEDYFRKAYTFNSGERNLEALLIDILRNKLLASESDPERLLKIIEEYEATFVGINKNSRFIDFKSISFLTGMALHFENFQRTKAEEYRKSFEEIAGEIGNDYILNELVPRAYTSAAMYYYTNGLYSKAKEVVKAGLKYNPNSWELKSKLKALSK